LPASWRAPRSTPLFDGSELGYELHNQATPVGFRIDVPPGRHDLAISHGAGAIRYHLPPLDVRHTTRSVRTPTSKAEAAGDDVTRRALC
jgi:hypothetical protein